MASSNKKDMAAVVSSRLEQGRIAIAERFTQRFSTAGKAIMQDALDSKKGWVGFTGQTATSLSCSVITKNSVQDLNAFKLRLFGAANMPRFRKIKKGERVFLKNPYAGKPRAVEGSVDVNHEESGIDTAKEIVTSAQLEDNTIVKLRVATGTEYSELLESKGGSVLSSAMPSRGNGGSVKVLSDKMDVSI